MIHLSLPPGQGRDFGLMEVPVGIWPDYDLETVRIQIDGLVLLLSPGDAADLASRIIGAAMRVRKHQLGE